jgi:hypothetical protein
MARLVVVDADRDLITAVGNIKNDEIAAVGLGKAFGSTAHALVSGRWRARAQVVATHDGACFRMEFHSLLLERSDASFQLHKLIAPMAA